ncbi:hypothetical protein B0J15DRAFT_505043 [Fusarium solani]|jgi:hypothetical protein|uniref:Secreted protein n=1 Tax=Fusarium solani TaxID=169388 RepID=A0A9P9G5W6_FUSSL|nr:uncharacterized protein B0J15DRAFT_505043 [Fusarium solani]KAH7232577.1 hypothetical protein B0J15DRAFT_505043 [Fusarium solani]
MSWLVFLLCFDLPPPISSPRSVHCKLPVVVVTRRGVPAVPSISLASHHGPRLAAFSRLCPQWGGHHTCERIHLKQKTPGNVKSASRKTERAVNSEIACDRQVKRRTPYIARTQCQDLDSWIPPSICQHEIAWRWSLARHTVKSKPLAAPTWLGRVSSRARVVVSRRLVR